MPARQSTLQYEKMATSAHATTKDLRIVLAEPTRQHDETADEVGCGPNKVGLGSEDSTAAQTGNRQTSTNAQHRAPIGHGATRMGQVDARFGIRVRPSSPNVSQGSHDPRGVANPTLAVFCPFPPRLASFPFHTPLALAPSSLLLSCSFLPLRFLYPHFYYFQFQLRKCTPLCSFRF